MLITFLLSIIVFTLNAKTGKYNDACINTHFIITLILMILEYVIFNLKTT